MTDLEVASSRQKRAKPFSPVLDHILNGGPGITFDVHRCAASANGRRLFSSEFLNNVIMFKYPSASMPLSDAGKTKGNAPVEGQSAGPVQTGIFMPYDRARPEDGGQAFYVRHRNFNELLRLHIGLTDEPERLNNDLTIIRTIDKVPTLDPFLMRVAFANSKILVDQAFFEISSEEEVQIRALITAKITPILARALGGDAAKVNAAAAGLVDALWSPASDAGQPFMRAFGVPAEAVASVLSGWKGVTYFQHQFEQTAPVLTRIVSWLKSPKATPRDVRKRSFEAEQFAMASNGIAIGLGAVIHRVTDAFARYEYAFAAMLNEADASPFIEFLKGVERSYWQLGYQTASLRTMAHWYQRDVAANGEAPLTSVAMTTMVRRFRHALDSQMDVAKHVQH